MVYKSKRCAHPPCHGMTVHLLNKLWDDGTCTKVKRNLFGYYESRAVYQLLDKQVSSMAERSQEEWNFDFAKESPKSGRYLWQKVSHSEVPLFYAAIGRPALKHNICRQDAEVIQNKNPAERRIRESSPKNKENDVVAKDDRKKPRLVQTTIKDYSRVVKRRSLRLKQLQLYSPRLRTADSRRTP